MKKLLGVGLSCFVVLVSGITVFAEEAPQTCHIGGCYMGECFMDTDCDGICGDHAFVDEDGDGICDNHCYIDEDENGICDHFIDDDEDGICDHCHEHGKPVRVNNSRTTQRGSSHHGGHHRGGHHGHC